MKRVVTAALGAVALSLSLSAPAMADVVLFQTTGSDQDFFYPYFSIYEAGTYDFELSVTRDIDVAWHSNISTHYDVFVAPPPKPHAENLEGSNGSSLFYENNSGSYFKYTMVLIEPQISYFVADNRYEYRGVAAGTLLYSEFRHEGGTGRFDVYPNSADPFEFTFTVTKRETAPVPEPATWALMILGFGAVGGAMRARRREAWAA